MRLPQKNRLFVNGAQESHRLICTVWNPLIHIHPSILYLFWLWYVYYQDWNAIQYKYFYLIFILPFSLNSRILITYYIINTANHTGMTRVIIISLHKTLKILSLHYNKIKITTPHKKKHKAALHKNRTTCKFISIYF